MHKKIQNRNVNVVLFQKQSAPALEQIFQERSLQKLKGDVEGALLDLH